MKAEYGYVRNYVKELWQQHGNNVDLILHLGMVDGWNWYTVERSAWKKDRVFQAGNGTNIKVKYYTIPDGIGQTIKDVPEPCPWGEEVPNQLWALPGIDIDALASKAQKTANVMLEGKEKRRIEVRPHDDAGPYLCGFISYESLAHAFVNRYSARTLFCHIPGGEEWKTDESLELGGVFVCALISQIAAKQVEI